MSRCKSILESKEQCSRNAIPFGKYCWQHSERKVLKLSLVTLLITVIGILSDVISLTDYATSSIDKELTEKEIICDRNIEDGCYLNFSEENFTSKGNLEINGTKSVGNVNLSILAGETISSRSGIDILPFKNKKFKLALSSPASPYYLNYENNQLHFSGEIRDIENNNEVLGWFTGNEFGINKPCAFSWNKDEKGIEIIDKYGKVCFSIDVITKKELKERREITKMMEISLRLAKEKLVQFKGFFKHEDTYYVYNDKLTKTKSLDEAKELISKIEKNFEHFGPNSLGKRKTNKK